MYHKVKKFIFVHIPKTAGTSISTRLRGPVLRGKVMNNNPHVSMEVYNENLKKLHEYFKFTCTRNPWDRMVSLYFHNKTHKQQGVTDDYSFEKFIKCHDSINQWTLEKMCFVNEEDVIDYYIKFDNLEQDVKYVFERLGLNKKIPKITHGTIRLTKDYRQFYNEETLKRVYDIHKHEIEKFGYEF